MTDIVERLREEQTALAVARRAEEWREDERLGAAIARAQSAEQRVAELLDALWNELCEKDDRTSPADYPDMALITRAELADFLDRRPASSRDGESGAGWQPIETAPNDEWVFVGAWVDGEWKFYKSMRFYEVGNELEGENYAGWFWAQDYGDIEDHLLTHWQPLPSPPKGEEQ